MKRNLGSSAGILALSAVALHMVNAPVAEKSANREAPASAAVQSAAPQDTSKSAEPDRGRQIEGPWLATQTFFHQKPRNTVCFSGELCKAERRRLPCCGFLERLRSRHVPGTEACRGQLLSYFGFANHHTQFLIASVPDPLHTRSILVYRFGDRGD